MSSFYWPDGDTRLWRLKCNFPRKSKILSNMRILVTRVLPIGDFDSQCLPDLSGEPARIYKTNHGWRVFYIGRVTDNFQEMIRLLERHGADRDYIMFFKETKTYPARIDPKTIQTNDNWAITKFVSEVGRRKPEWNSFIEEHDRLTRATSGLTNLV